MKVSSVLILYFLITSPLARALVGGHKSYNTENVVSLRYPNGLSYCTGALVGTSPVTILTAAHCLEKFAGPTHVVINGHHAVQGLVGRKDIPGLDLAVLVMGTDFKSPLSNAKNTFTLPGPEFSMHSYRGPVKMCGYGVEIPQIEMSQLPSENLKCGEGLYLAGLSDLPGFHRLFSYKIMQCEGLAYQEELNSMNDYAEIMKGDSGGPLFVEENGQNILIGIAHAVVAPDLSKEKDKVVKCDVEHGRPFQQGWTSLTKANPMANKFLQYAAKVIGADIKGL